MYEEATCESIIIIVEVLIKKLSRHLKDNDKWFDNAVSGTE